MGNTLENTRMVAANGLQFNVLELGNPEGEPMVFLHGFPDSIKVWRLVLEDFAKVGYRVIAYDQRGFGQTDAPAEKEAYEVTNMIEDFCALMDALQVQQKVKLVGHDWGSRVGWQIVMRKPERVSSFVAISVGHPAAYLVDGGTEQMMRAWYTLFNMVEGKAERAYEHDNWAFFRIMNDNPPELDVNWIADLSRPGRHTAALNWYRANASARHFGTVPQTPPVTVPVLGIYSDGDIYLTESQMRESGKYTDAEYRYAKIEGCSHWIPLEKPAEMVAEILDFYAKIGG